MKTISCIGELLIDFICTDIDSSLAEGLNFKKMAGGAPANVTAAIAKLGGRAAFIGAVGADPFGTFLEKSIKEVGVDTSMMKFSAQHSTTLAFVSLQASGERDFVFNRGADAELLMTDIDTDKIKKSALVHFGSATGFLNGSLKSTYSELLDFCTENRIYISFDPNYRIDLWKNRDDEFIKLSEYFINRADLIKLSDDELKFLTGIDDIETAVKSLHVKKNAVVMITLGSRGTYVYSAASVESAIVESIRIKSIDSTGAGDAFTGAVLYRIALDDNPFEFMSDFSRVKDITAFGNKVGAVVCTKIGAIASMPDLNEVNSL